MGIDDKVDATGQNALRTRLGVTHQMAASTERCPRLVWIMFPLDKGPKVLSPKKWWTSFLKKKVRLYLICQHSYTVLESPLEMEVTRDWVRQVAPALKVTVMLLSALSVSGLPFPLPIPVDTIQKSLEKQQEFVNTLLAKDTLQQLENEMKKDSEITTLSGQNIQLITGPAYDILSEKLNKDQRSGWKDKLHPVLDKGGSLMYVKTKFLHEYQK